MKTLTEYFATNNGVELSEAKDSLNELKSVDVHENCNSDETACKLCLFETLLRDYKNFINIETDLEKSTKFEDEIKIATAEKIISLYSELKKSVNIKLFERNNSSIKFEFSNGNILEAHNEAEAQGMIHTLSTMFE